MRYAIAKLICLFFLIFINCKGDDWYFSLDVDGINSLPISADSYSSIKGKGGNGLIIKSSNALPNVTNWKTEENCLTNPSICNYGISFGFWIMLQNFTEPVTNIFSTTIDNSTGFKITYSSLDNNIRFYIYFNDSYLECAGKINLNKNITAEWFHVTGSWIKLYSYQSLWVDTHFVKSCDGISNRHSFSSTTFGRNLTIGSKMSDSFYYIDELYLRDKIFYNKEVKYLFGKNFSLFYYFSLFIDFLFYRFGR